MLYLRIVIYSILVILCLAGMAIALRSTVKKTVASLVTTVIAAILPLFFTPAIVSASGGYLIKLLMDQLPNDITSNQVLARLISDFSVALASVIVFSVFFILFKVLLTIICVIAFPKREGSFKSVAISLPLHIVNALLIAYIIITPTYALVTATAADADVVLTADVQNVDFVAAKEELFASTGDFLTEEDIAKTASKHTPLSSLIYDKLTALEVNGEKTNLHTETYSVCSTLATVGEKAPKEFGDELDVETVDFAYYAFNECLENNTLGLVLMEVIHDACTNFAKDKPYCETISLDALDEDMKPVVMTLCKDLSLADKKEMKNIVDGFYGIVRFAVASGLTTQFDEDMTSTELIALLKDKGNLSSLFSSVNEQNADIIASTFSGALGSIMPDAEEFSKSFIDNITKISDEEMEKEVEATMEALEIIGPMFSGEEKVTSEKVADLVAIAAKSETVSNTLTDYSEKGAEGIKLNETEKQAAAKALNEAYANASEEDKEKMGETLNAVAQLLNLGARY